MAKYLMASWAVVLAFGNHDLNAGPFQRMRIPAGVFEIGSRGGQITAICLDGPARPAPTPRSYYSGGSNSITVTRVTPQKTETLPYDRAVKEWVDVKGRDSATILDVTPKKPDPDVKYRLNVAYGGRGVIGESPAEVSDILGKVGDRVEHLDDLDNFTVKLEASLGQDSAISAAIRKIKYVIESKLQKFSKNDSTTVSDKFVPLIRKLLAPPDATPSQRLENVTVLHGAFLSDAQIASLRELHIDVAAQYDADSRARCERFAGFLSKIRAAFGEKSGLETEFHAEVQRALRATHDLDKSIADARSRAVLVRPEIRQLSGQPGARDALSLLFGKRLSDAQVNALEAVFDWKAGPETGQYDDCVYITRGLDGIQFRTTSSEKDVTTTDLHTKLQEVLKAKHRVILDWSVGPEIATELYRQGVHFARTIDHVLRPHAEETKNAKLIFAIADDPHTNKIIFGEEQNSAAIARAAEVAASIPKETAVLVKSKKELLAAMANLKPDERGVLVYHGTTKIQFADGEVEIRSLLDRCDPLSCSTFKILGFGGFGVPVSTGKIDIEQMCMAAKSAIASARRLGLNVPDGTSFLEVFIEKYRSGEKSAGRKEGWTTILIMGLGPGLAAIVQALDDKRKKGKGNDEAPDESSESPAESSDAPPKSPKPGAGSPKPTAESAKAPAESPNGSNHSAAEARK
jgi:hypothetical protein